MSIRRLTAVIVQCALITMSLVGSGVRCDDAGHAAHMDMADTSMPGMPMADMPMPDMPMSGEGGKGSTDSHSDCSFPWSPAQCESMTSCAPSAMTIEQLTVAVNVIVAHEEPVVHEHGLRSVTRAPEPPPPRA